jgi:molybdopterin converting factor small subunit
MAVTFIIPGALRELAGNRQEVRLEGADGPLSAALARLWTECPGIRDRVITERGAVRTHVNIFVDGENIKYVGGLDAPVRDGAEIFLVAAVSGG